MNVFCKSGFAIGTMLLISGAVLAAQIPKTTPKTTQPNPAAQKALRDAGALIQAGKFQEAEPLLTARSSFSAGAHRHGAAGSRKRHHRVSARDVTGSCRAQYHYVLGREEFALGNWELAARSYQRASELDPAEALFGLSLGNAQFRAENYAAAAAAFEKTAKLDPKTEDIEYLIGCCARALGKLDEAKEHFRRQLGTDPKHVRARAGIGFILLEQADLEGAQKELEQAVALDPENVDAVFDLAMTCAREKQADKAMQYFERALQLSPDNTQAHYQLFLLYTRNNRPEKAKAELEVFHRLEELDKMVRREESLLTKARKELTIRIQGRRRGRVRPQRRHNRSPESLSRQPATSNDTGGTKKGVGYDVARFQWIDPQALIQFGRKSIRLCPRREVTELLFHDGAGPVFHCTAYDRTIAPELSRKSESIAHVTSHLRRIEGWANKHYFNTVRFAVLSSK